MRAHRCTGLGHRDGRRLHATPTRRAARPRRRRRGRSGRRRRAVLPRRRARSLDAARAARRRGGAPRLRLPVRERRLRRAPCADAGLDLDRPAGRRRSSSWATRRAPSAWRARAGVPVVPGAEGERRRRRIRAFGGEHGFPVVIKAVGGRRRQGHARRARAGRAAERARRRAARGAGGVRRRPRARRALPRRARATSRCRCSPTATAPCVHLGERECSLQRRHQKVVEEAPSPRRRRRAARADGRRRGARSRGRRLRRRRHGRVRAPARRRRVLLPRDEHAAAGRAPGHRGWSTGVDLVEQQLRVAAGEPLALAPGRTLRRAGTRSRRASTRRIRRAASCPRSAALAARGARRAQGVRVDAGIGPGQEIGTDYDPMLAKVIAHGDRTARRALRAAATVRWPGCALLGAGDERGVHPRACSPRDDVRAGRASTRAARARARRAARRAAGRPAARRRDRRLLGRTPPGSPARRAVAARVRRARRGAVRDAEVAGRRAHVGVERRRPAGDGALRIGARRRSCAATHVAVAGDAVVGRPRRPPPGGAPRCAPRGPAPDALTDALEAPMPGTVLARPRRRRRRRGERRRR